MTTCGSLISREGMRRSDEMTIDGTDIEPYGTEPRSHDQLPDGYSIDGFHVYRIAGQLKPDYGLMIPSIFSVADLNKVSAKLREQEE